MERKPARILVALAALTMIVWLVRGLWLPSVQGDGVGLYAPLASLLFDHDLDFHNEFQHSRGSVRRAWLTGADGRPVNPYAVGAALLWTPPVAAVWLFDAKRDSYRAPDRWRNSSPGFQPRYVNAVAIGTALEAVLGAVLLYRLLRRHGGATAAALGAGAATLGTPLLYYALAMPSYAHTASFFTCTLLLVATTSADGRSLRSFLLLGALWGLASLVRYQDAVLGVLAAPHLLRALRLGRRAAAARIGLFVAAAVLVFLPQCFYWQRVYGGPLVTSVPILMHWTRPHILPFLFSTWQGAVLWSPVIGLGILGLRRLADRPLRLALWAAVGLEIYVCAATGDWWGSAACGARRLVVIAPIVGLGVGLGFQHGFLWRHRQPARRRIEVWRAAVILVAIAWNVRLTQYYAAQLLPKNPGNAADYMRSFPLGHPFLQPWQLWDYRRFAAELLEAERRLPP